MECVFDLIFDTVCKLRISVPRYGVVGYRKRLELARIGTRAGHLAVVASLIYSGKDYIRPISGRYMHQREIEQYEKGKKASQFLRPTPRRSLRQSGRPHRIRVSDAQPVRFEFEKKAARITKNL